MSVRGRGVKLKAAILDIKEAVPEVMYQQLNTPTQKLQTLSWAIVTWPNLTTRKPGSVTLLCSKLEDNYVSIIVTNILSHYARPFPLKSHNHLRMWGLELAPFENY